MYRSLRITVTCEQCGFKQQLERRVERPEIVHVICHGCEDPLDVDVRAEHFVRERPVGMLVRR